MTIRRVRFPAPPTAIVDDDQTFGMRGLLCRYLLRASAPAGYALKSVVVNGVDVTNTPYRFADGDTVTVLFSSSISTVSGRVTDADGKPSPNCELMVFPQERDGWISSSAGLRRATTYTDGRFRVTGLLAGRYLIIAAERGRLAAPPGFDSTFFEALAADATAFAIGADDQRTVDLRVIKP